MTAIYARVKNWAEFQHYKDRRPPWIKLHRVLLDDRAFGCLPVASKALAPLVWLLASEDNRAEVDVSMENLIWRLRWRVEDLHDGLIGLFEKGFLEDYTGKASDMLATCLQPARPETETETETETEVETEMREKRETASVAAPQLALGEEPSAANGQGFSDFWDAYPRKVGKAQAAKIWIRLRPTAALRKKIHDTLTKAIASEQWRKNGGQYIPHPSTWLNQGRWDDEVPPPAPAAPTPPAQQPFGGRKPLED